MYALRPGSSAPLTLQVAEIIVDAIRGNALRAGDRLPGQRKLAGQLGVSRTTVVRAYEELESQGWTEARESSGTFVASKLPDEIGPVPQGAMPRDPAFDVVRAGGTALSRGAPQAAIVANLAGGMPDLRTIPLDDLARAWRRAVRREGRALLGYGPPEGHPALREALAAFLRQTRGLRCGAQEVLVARGAQMCAYLAIRALIRPGDVVAVEAYGYEAVWAVLRMCGAHIVPIPVDADGLDVEMLERLCLERRVRAVYVTPHHQFPTMAVLSAARRIRLLNLARRHRFAILEDDYDHEFHYEGRPVLPLAADDTAGAVVYIGSMSKVLAPGLRTGYVVAPRSLIDTLVELRTIVDRQGDLPMEAALAELLSDGTVERHVRRARRIYRGRRELFVELLREHLPDDLAFEMPAGGLSLWARTHLSARAWEARARGRGVWVHAGWRFAQPGAAVGAMRLGFAAANETELVAGVRTLAASRPPATSQ
jgi:GntR family transcriptional regulator / MocR family aminotransferase